MNIETYLQRIGYVGDRRPNADTLRDLQLAHMLTVPFENLDIYLGRQIVLDLPLLHDKIVERRRGGFCYELNGLFAWLLQEMGFSVTLLSASVARSNGGFGPEFDHLTLLVGIHSQVEDGKRWLVDVGFGDSFMQPLIFDGSDLQAHGRNLYRLVEDGDYRVLRQKDGESLWADQYRFGVTSRAFDDFEAMCHYHQSSPQSSFTQKRLCTLATSTGRFTLSDDRFIVSEHGLRTERLLKGEEDFLETLREKFKITLE